MNTIARVARIMQTVLLTSADQVARETGFVRRKRKLTGSSFVQTLVISCLQSPAVSYTDLTQGAAVAGIEISGPGLLYRFTRAAALFMQKMLEYAVKQVIVSRAAAVPILQRFRGVYLRDSSVISLPVALAELWPGVGGSKGKTSALKLQVDLDFRSGRLHGPVLQAGRTQDQLSPYQQQRLPKGALHLADLGYFRLDKLAEDNRNGVYWLTRLKAGTVVCSEEGTRIDLPSWLRAQSQTRLDVPVLVGARKQIPSANQDRHIQSRLRLNVPDLVGARKQIPCRLLVERVPQEVAEQRRRRLKEYARKTQTTLKRETLALTNWTLLITNVPLNLLSLPEALVLSRVRWQVELLFKLWKSCLLVDEWRSENPWRILCEVYAKLIAVVIVHWLVLTSIWERPDRSLTKAAKAVGKFAVALALQIHDQAALSRVLTRLQICLRATCTMNRRRKHPNTYQLLLEFA